MIIDLNFLKNAIPYLLNKNPSLGNSSLSGVIAAQIINFQGYIQISDSSDGYEGIQKPVKIIYISPYGFWLDLLVSIKRIFTGIVFSPSNANGDLRPDLAQGRRITIFCALDGSEAEALIETDKQPLFLRVYKAIFSC